MMTINGFLFVVVIWVHPSFIYYDKKKFLRKNATYDEFWIGSVLGDLSWKETMNMESYSQFKNQIRVNHFVYCWQRVFFTHHTTVFLLRGFLFNSSFHCWNVQRIVFFLGHNKRTTFSLGARLWLISLVIGNIVCSSFRYRKTMAFSVFLTF